MAFTNLKQYREQLRQRTFARAERFEVTFDSIPGQAGTDVQLYCEEVQIPGAILSNKEFNIGPWTFFRNTKLGFLGNEINFTFLTTNDWLLRKNFEMWINDCVNAKSQEIAYPESIQSTVKIDCLDMQDNVTMRWTLYEAMPKVLNLVPLSHGTTAAVRNTLIMSAAYWESNVLKSIASG